MVKGIGEHECDDAELAQPQGGEIESESFGTGSSDCGGV